MAPHKKNNSGPKKKLTAAIRKAKSKKKAEDAHILEIVTREQNEYDEYETNYQNAIPITEESTQSENFVAEGFVGNYIIERVDTRNKKRSLDESNETDKTDETDELVLPEQTSETTSAKSSRKNKKRGARGRLTPEEKARRKEERERKKEIDHKAKMEYLAALAEEMLHLEEESNKAANKPLSKREFIWNLIYSPLSPLSKEDKRRVKKNNRKLLRGIKSMEQTKLFIFRETQTSVSAVPHTPKQVEQIQKKQKNTPNEFVSADHIHTDVQKDIQYVFRKKPFSPKAITSLKKALSKMFLGIFEEQFIQMLVQSIEEGDLDNCSGVNSESRGQCFVLHLGALRHYSAKNIRYAATDLPEVVQFLEDGSLFFKEFQDIMKVNWPALMEFLRSSGTDCEFGGYPSVAIVFGSTDQIHTDKSDTKNGLCTIVPVGDFEGVNLLFPTLNQEIKLENGDLISFKSHSLPHGTTPMKGAWRFSLVFFADHNLFTAVNK